jgi:molybdate transport system regulatory protein
MAHGGGARVTPLGEQVLSCYRALQAGLRGAADTGELEALNAAMRVEPKANQKA